MNTKEEFFEEQKKANIKQILEKSKKAAAKKYSLPQKNMPLMGIDTSLLLECNK